MNRIMRIHKSKFFALFMLLSVCCVQCSLKKTYTGVLTKQTLPVTTFDGIAASGKSVIYLRRGKTQEVIVVAPNDLPIEKLIRTKGKTLQIKDLLEKVAEPIEFYITVPHLVQLVASGNSEIRSSSLFSSPNMEISISGSSKVLWEGEHVNLTVNASGRTNMKLSGKSIFTHYNTSGSSQISANKLISKEVAINTSGLSKVQLHAAEALTARASGISRIEYFGSPSKQSLVETGSAVIVKQNIKTL
jgi:hypothetical protein